MKPLITYENLEELLKSFQDKIVKRFKHKLEQLESKLAMKQTAIYKLVKCDDSEQYSQRSCVRIHGLDFKSDEHDVMGKVARC